MSEKKEYTKGDVINDIELISKITQGCKKKILTRLLIENKVKVRDIWEVYNDLLSNLRESSKDYIKNQVKTAEKMFKRSDLQIVDETEDAIMVFGNLTSEEQESFEKAIKEKYPDELKSAKDGKDEIKKLKEEKVEKPNYYSISWDDTPDDIVYGANLDKLVEIGMVIMG